MHWGAENRKETCQRDGENEIARRLTEEQVSHRRALMRAIRNIAKVVVLPTFQIFHGFRARRIRSVVDYQELHRSDYSADCCPFNFSQKRNTIPALRRSKFW
jgi:hypothetical protein